MNRGKTIAIAGNQSTCADILCAVCQAGYDVACLLHMDASHSDGIADYQDLRPLAESLGVPVVHPATYAMKDDASRRQFEGMGIDLLISAGWQRIFLQWWMWDEPVRTTEILSRILKNRGAEQDRYLRSSNSLWQQFHEGARS